MVVRNFAFEIFRTLKIRPTDYTKYAVSTERWLFVFVFVIAVETTCISVSYTHLDVYKRQQLYCIKHSFVVW